MPTSVLMRTVTSNSSPMLALVGPSTDTVGFGGGPLGGGGAAAGAVTVAGAAVAAPVMGTGICGTRGC